MRFKIEINPDGKWVILLCDKVGGVQSESFIASFDNKDDAEKALADYEREFGV